MCFDLFELSFYYRLTVIQGELISFKYKTLLSSFAYDTLLKSVEDYSASRVNFCSKCTHVASQFNVFVELVSCELKVSPIISSPNLENQYIAQRWQGCVYKVIKIRLHTGN